MKFTHLHVHSHYSLLDGLPKIGELLDYAKELGMDSVALTDHGVMYGAVEFYKKAKERGIKPIIGCEVYLSQGRMEEKRPKIDDKRYHLVLLVKNEEGYKNLVTLVTKAHLEGFYYKPRIDEELLAKHSKGLIALSACVAGKIPRLIVSDKIKEAEKTALKYQEIFGKGNFYLEIQNHPHIKDQEKANKGIISIAKKLNIPLVATNDVHYLRPEDAEAQDILMLINTGADLNDPERLTIKSDNFSLRTPKEMAETFKNVPEAIENTQKIAEMCNFELELGKTKLPRFETPNGKTPDEYLEELCAKGIKNRFGQRPEKETLSRLNYELSVIKQTGFAGYFLIVQDFVNWAKQQRIIVGPGRGSAPGSLVSYLLNITNIDPLKNNLLFERFLNPSRISMPDIDLDFTDRRRDEVIGYVADKYGANNVAQIITFGTMAARAVIRDVGRALGYEYSYCDKIAKMIPFGFTLEKTLKNVSEFKNIYKADEKAERLIDLAKKLEGVVRHASTHACGVVISAEPLSSLIPLQRPTQNDKTTVTQYEMHAIEDLGLLKMDFLGLKNLTIIEDTLSRIYVIQNKKVDIEKIPLDDKRTYHLLQKASSTGIFQLESDGMKRYLRQLKPTEFEDIVAMVALYRPGPIQFIPDYIARKQKRQEIRYLHPRLKPILEKTQGICIYQEQIMQIAQKIAGFSLAEADVLRKAVGKKIKNLLLEQEKKFIKGAVENGIGKNIAQKIWQWILPFARYGFNRCLTSDTEIVNAKTGEITVIQQLLGRKKLPPTFSNEENLKLEREKIIAITENGVKPVYRVTTRLGKQIKTTTNHPLLTVNGWKELSKLSVGDKIALARRIPLKLKNLPSVKKHHLVVLGYLLSEGNLCHPAGFYVYTTNQEELNDYIRALEKFKNTKATLNKSKRAISVYAGRINLKQPSEAVKWVEKIGIKEKKARQKEFPNFVFKLSRNQLSLLIAKMFQGDGCVNDKRKYPQVFYATSSYNLARQLQHLLLRLEIISSLHTKKFKYRGGIKIGYTLNITRYESLEKFYQQIGPNLIGKPKKTLEKIIANHPIISGKIKTNSARGSKDVVPAEIIKIIKEEIKKRKYKSLKEFARSNGFSERLLQKDSRKKGYLRETLQLIGKTLNSKIILNYAQSDIYWDEIVKIESIGKEKTYDLTIKSTHNFLANDFIVHNSHATAYAMIAYQTAYLKANFPVEFMASLLTSEKTDIERIAILIEECKRMGIEVLPPDINESLKNFTVVPGKNKIRFGLLAIKNVGENVIDAIVKEAKDNGRFKNIEDFTQRIEAKNLNKKSMESLIKSGAFDEFGERQKLLYNLERLLEWAREKQKNKINGQKDLFGKTDFNNHIKLDSVKPATNFEKLNWEKELLGLYVSSHPLEDFRNILSKKTTPLNKIKSAFSGQRVLVGGIISGIKKIITKTGKPMLFLKLEDLGDKKEVVVFPTVIDRNPTVFQENKIVFISGRVDHRDNDPKIIAENAEEIIRK